MANQLISLPPKLLRSQPSTHRAHPSTEQPATSNQASTQGKHADHPETCFLFTILRRLKHRKRQRALRACRTDCRNRANNTDAAPKNDELAALGGRKPKEIKYLYNRRGRRRSTAQLSVAGVEALPSVAGVEALPRRRISCESVVTAAARRAGAPPPRASSYHHDSCHDACHACLCWTWSHDTCPFSSLFSFSRAATRSSNGRISCSRLFFSVRSQRSIS